MKASTSSSSNQASDAYSSVDLVHLANFERKFCEDLTEVIGRLPTKSGLLKKYTSDYELTSIEGTSHLPDHVGAYDWAAVVASHPFLAFRLIRRMIVDIPIIIQFLKHQNESAVLNKIRSRQRYLKWPTIADKEDIMSRILQIQTVYDYDVQKYAKGELDSLGGSLSVVHCVEIGRHAMSIEKYASAVEWMNIAIGKCFTKRETDINLDQVTDELQIAADEHDRMLAHHMCRHSGNLGNLWEHDLFQVRIEKLASFKKDRLRHLPQHPNDILFRALELCKGNTNGTKQQTDKFKAKLKCRYDTKRFSYSRISPMKLEILSKKPYLVRVYEFISNEGIRNVLDKTSVTLSELVSAKPINDSTENKTLHGIRPRHNSAIIAMEDKEVGLAFKNISSKLERFALNGRDQCSGGGLRVLGHAFGNSDLQLEPADTGIDARLDVPRFIKFTSVLIFLNDVELGGLTVFPNIGLTVEPVAGSALFWRNLVGGGIRDRRLARMECPVILGGKWVATKKLRADSTF